MRKLYNLKTVEKDNHTMFTYEDGKKTPIPDDGVVFCYLAPETENGRMLKATEWPDRAGAIDGKFVCIALWPNLSSRINGLRDGRWPCCLRL